MNITPTYKSDRDTLISNSEFSCMILSPRPRVRVHRVQTPRSLKPSAPAGLDREVMVNETRKGRRSEGQFTLPWHGRSPWWLSALKNLFSRAEVQRVQKNRITGRRYSLRYQTPFKGDAMTVVKSRAVFEYRSECTQLSRKLFCSLNSPWKCIFLFVCYLF